MSAGGWFDAKEAFGASKVTLEISGAIPRASVEISRIREPSDGAGTSFVAPIG